jgi:hypothetical protein
MFNLSQKVKTELWWLIISVDYHYNRIAIADYELTSHELILWLEDKQDYKNTLEECLKLTIPIRCFGKLIKTEGLNSYEAMLMHPAKQFLYPATVEISKPITWYNYDATPVEQRWAREAALKNVLTYLVENEHLLNYNYAI